MGNSLLAVRGINHKYIVVERGEFIMSEILASVLSSGVVAAVITKLSNDHDRKKNHLIEEAKERRNELRRISRELESVKKYNKNIKRKLKDLKL